MTTPINLADKLGAFDDAWNPRVAAVVNGQEVRLAKLRGAFVWHAHEDADELFLVVEGAMRIGIRDPETSPSRERGVTHTADDPRLTPGARVERAHRDEIVRPGEMIVIPAGVEHRPAAEPEGSTCSVVIINRAGAVNTGTATGTPEAGGFTRDELEEI